MPVRKSPNTPQSPHLSLRTDQFGMQFTNGAIQMKYRSIRAPFMYGLLAIALLISMTLWIGCGDSDAPNAPEVPQETLIPSAPPVGLGIPAVIAIQNRHTDNLMEIEGVVGTATGLGADGAPSVLVLTQTPGVAGIPQQLEGAKVSVRVIGDVRALKHKPGHDKGGGGGDDELPPTARWPRPVPIGISTGHPDITAGTIGCRVKDASGTVYALSNNHVYANSNSASIGDNVLQPGTFDGGINPADTIGTLFDFAPIVFSTSANNVIDAAIAITTTANLGNATPAAGYGIPKSTTVAPTVGMQVQKFGRTTGKTKGRIDAINATVNVSYGAPGTARFVNQLIIIPGAFSSGGDSGSLIVGAKGKDARKPVGLLFAGSTFVTIANPIDDVLDQFGVTIDGE
jgi:hypothetical protein